MGDELGHPAAVAQGRSGPEAVDGKGAGSRDEGEGAEPGQDELGDGAPDRWWPDISM
jgi:hypothetical protein